LIDTEFNQHERISFSLPPTLALYRSLSLSLSLSVALHIFSLDGFLLLIFLYIFLIYASQYNSAWFITEIGKRFCFVALQLVAFSQQYKKRKNNKILKKRMET